eukprot:6187649-Pleurochrysis_carterae.AAC.2
MHASAVASIIACRLCCAGERRAYGREGWLEKVGRRRRLPALYEAHEHAHPVVASATSSCECREGCVREDANDVRRVMEACMPGLPLCFPERSINTCRQVGIRPMRLYVKFN